MQLRDLGVSGLRVSTLGFGAGRIGGGELSELEAQRLLGEVLDLGITLIDTARSYGLSEERIGRHLAHRRGEFVLSTKGGYGVAGASDWTADAVTRGIDDALRRLRTDSIDVFHLHSCAVEILERQEVLRALDDAKAAGKIRIAAYSGENGALDHAVACGAFGAVQCSVNVCDQRSLAGAIPLAVARGLGVIAKRPIANAAWRFREGDGQSREYSRRLQAMDLAIADEAWLEVALRFSAFAPEVASVIVGTRHGEHLRRNLELFEKGPLPETIVRQLKQSFVARGGDWEGQI